ncbi:BAG domain-containing protein Samui-like [Argonauta hians]
MSGFGHLSQGGTPHFPLLNNNNNNSNNRSSPLLQQQTQPMYPNPYQPQFINNNNSNVTQSPQTGSGPTTGPAAGSSQLGELPSGWETRVDPNTGWNYFVDHNTRHTTWQDPRIGAATMLPFSAVTSNNNNNTNTIGGNGGSGDSSSSGGGGGGGKMVEIPVNHEMSHGQAPAPRHVPVHPVTPQQQQQQHLKQQQPQYHHHSPVTGGGIGGPYKPQVSPSQFGGSDVREIPIKHVSGGAGMAPNNSAVPPHEMHANNPARTHFTSHYQHQPAFNYPHYQGQPHAHSPQPHHLHQQQQPSAPSQQHRSPNHHQQQHHQQQQQPPQQQQPQQQQQHPHPQQQPPHMQYGYPASSSPHYGAGGERVIPIQRHSESPGSNSSPKSGRKPRTTYMQGPQAYNSSNQRQQPCSGGSTGGVVYSSEADSRESSPSVNKTSYFSPSANTTSTNPTTSTNNTAPNSSGPSDIAASASCTSTMSTASVPKSPLEIVENIVEQAKNLGLEVNSFRGSKTDKNYKYLEEMLTRMLLKLDNVQAGSDDNIRQARKHAVNTITQTLDLLELKGMSGADDEPPQPPPPQQDDNKRVSVTKEECDADKMKVKGDTGGTLGRDPSSSSSWASATSHSSTNLPATTSNTSSDSSVGGPTSRGSPSPSKPFTGGYAASDRASSSEKEPSGRVKEMTLDSEVPC